MALRKLGATQTDPNQPIDQYGEDPEQLFGLPGEPNPNPTTSNPILAPAAPAPTPTPFSPEPAPDDRTANPEPVSTDGGAGGISQLPDGTGGVVNVPPPGMAPPEPLGLSPVPPAPVEPALPPAFVPPAPMDTTPSTPLEQPFIPPAAPLDEPPQTAPFVPVNPPPPSDVDPGSIPGWEQPLGVTPQTAQPIDATPPAVVPPPPAPPEVEPRSVPETRAPEVAPIADVQPVTELPTFSPDENLIDTAILPSENLEAEEAERQANALLQSDIGQMTQGGDEVLPEQDPRVLKLQGYSDAAIEKIMNGPDRFGLAEEKWRDWLAKTAPDYEQVVRGATEEGAAHGRLGSGILTNRYGDIATSRTRDMDLTGKEFLRDALEGSVGDRERALGMIRDILGQEQGEGRAVRGERRAERETGYARRAGARDELRGAAADRVQRDAGTRDEFRGERDFQRSTASEAIARRIMQREMENSEQQQGFNNAITLMEQGARGNPSEAEMAASAQAAAEAAGYTGDIAELIRFYMLNRTLGQQQPAGG